MSEEGKFETLEEATVYENPWVKLKRKKVRRPGGSTAEWGMMEVASDGAFIVALSDDNEVCLIRQFRVPHEKYYWEIPSGGVDGGDPLEAAQRELREEAHLEAREWEKVGIVHPYPVFSTELSHIFLARGIYAVGGDKEEQRAEGISEVKMLPFKEVLAMIDRDEITHATDVVALLRVARKLGLC